jgi:hypothetical protein
MNASIRRICSRECEVVQEDNSMADSGTPQKCEFVSCFDGFVGRSHELSAMNVRRPHKK